jgi:endonuclease III
MKVPDRKKQVKRINPVLKKHYTGICALDFTNPVELMVATILSAQCTDVRVNIVTKDLSTP